MHWLPLQLTASFLSLGLMVAKALCLPKSHQAGAHFFLSRWLFHILDSGIALYHCKERNHCVSFFFVLFFLIEKKKPFFENFIHRYHIHIISIPRLPHALLSCLPQIHYFLLLKLLLLYMYTYTHTHTHICVHTLLSSFIAVCVYRCLGLTTWGHQGACPWRKLVIPFLAAIYCLHVFIQGPCEIPLILVDMSGFA